MMIQAVLSNPSHPEYGVAAIPFPIPRDQYAHCWLTTISSQRTKTLSDTMRLPDTVCSSSMRRERTVSSLTHRGTTMPGTVPLFPTPAVC